MDVLLNIARWLNLNHKLNIGEIDTSGDYTGSHDLEDSAWFEIVVNSFSLPLLHISVQHLALFPFQFLIELACLPFGLAKNDDSAIRRDHLMTQFFDSLDDLVWPSDEIFVVLDGLGYWNIGLSDSIDEVAFFLIFCRNRLDPRRNCSWEEQSLRFFWDLISYFGEYFLYVFLEALFEHFISLIKNQNPQISEIDDPSVHEIYQSTGSSNHKVHSSFELIKLSCHSISTIDRQSS